MLHGLWLTLRLSIVTTLVLGTAGCGYHLVGTTSNLPPELQSLHVSTFENQTRRADMDQRLTEAVIQEWVRRRRFQLSDSAKGVDLVLRGVITSVHVAPVTYDQSGRATDYQMTLSAMVQLEDVRGKEPVVLWQDRAFSRRTSYQVDVSALNYFDRQTEAMDEVAQEFARALVTAVLEGF